MTEDQFLRIYREQVGPLFAFVARRVARERELAEDVVQETWLRAVRAWGAEGIPASPQSWLRTVAGNLIRTHFRARRPESISALALEACLDPRRSAPPEAARILAFGLAMLRPGQAALLEAFHIDGKDTRTIAREADTSQRAIEGRLYRARRALRRRLEPLMIRSGETS